MEPPGLVRWSPPENDNTNAELFDFEIGGKENSFDLEQQASEARKRVVGLLQERTRLLAILGQLSTNNGASTVEGNSWREGNHQMKSETGSSSSGTHHNVSGSRKLIPGTGQDHWQGRSTRLSQESGVEEGDSIEIEALSGEDQELITSLQQANQQLICTVGHLQQLNSTPEIYEDTFEDGSDFPERRQLGELISKTKNLERLLKIEEPTLTQQLGEYLKNNLSQTEILSIEESEWNMEHVNMCNNCKSNLVSRVDCGVQTDASQTSDCHSAPGNVKEEEKNLKNAINGSIVSSSHQGTLQDITEERKRFMSLEIECNELKEKLKSVTAEKTKLQEENDQLKEHFTNQESTHQLQIERLEQDMKQYQNLIVEYQAGEQSRKREVDQVLLQARDVLERERQEKFASISEQNALRKQIENLSKTMKSMQFKNEELVRCQYNQEDQVDDFKRLKKLIQENGLPTIEQVIVLQRQNESYREDLINERKEKERLLSIKDKLRRDLDSTQSRISSLQEQVYKYREHIYFLQQRAKQDGPPGSPLISSPAFDMPPPPSPTSLNNPSRLYGNTSQQYINEGMLQANARKYPLMPFPENKKGPPGKLGEGPGTGKQWSGYGIQNAFPGGKFGRQMSLDAGDWKQRSTQGQAPQAWATDNSFNAPSGRHNSLGSYSSMRSGSLSGSSSEDGLELEKPGQYGVAGRRQNGRPGEELRPMQNFGPPTSTFEAWPRPNINSNRMPNPRNPRRYSSPVGNGIRSPNTDYWSPHQQIPAVPKPWQTPVEQNQNQFSAESMPPGLRQSADPWQPQSTLPSSSQAQSVVVTSASAESGTFMSGGFGTPR